MRTQPLAALRALAIAAALAAHPAGAQQREAAALIVSNGAIQPRAAHATLLAPAPAPAVVTFIQTSQRRPHDPRKLYPAIGGLVGLMVGIGYTLQNAMGSPPPKDAGRVTLIAVGAGAAIGWVVGEVVARRREAAHSR